MREEVRTVYWCDFCNKRYISKYWAEKHELYCTANPNRVCRTCDHNGSDNNIPLILNEFTELDRYPTIEEIRKSVEGCPACMLTIIRVMNLADYYMWNYQEEAEEFWRKINEEQYSNIGLY